MKKALIFFISLTIIVLTCTISKAEYFKDIILQSPDGVWTDVRAYSSLNTTVTALGANVRSLIIPVPQTLTTVTIPSTVILKFERDGSINNSGNLIINTKNIIAPDRPIFIGAGDVDFADGTVVRSSWFSDIEQALDKTLDNKVTLIISKEETIPDDAVVGDDVTLKWEASDNIITVGTGHTISNIKNIEAGSYQIFAGSGDFDFLDGSYLKSSWFLNLRLADSFTDDDNTDITIEVDQPETIDVSTVLDSHQHLKVTKGNVITINPGVTLSVASLEDCNYKIFDGSVIGLSKSRVSWWGPTIDGATDDRIPIQYAISSLTLGGDLLLDTGNYAFGLTTIGGHPAAFTLLSKVHFRGTGMDNTKLSLIDNSGDYLALFMPATVGATINNVSFSDLTIDQNTDGNPMTVFPPTGDSARTVVYLGGASEGFNLTNVKVDNIGGINTIVVTDYVNIDKCQFTNVGTVGGTEYDHSTIYTFGEHNKITNSLFKGTALSAAGARTAIETHGGFTEASNNTIENYYTAFNLTGIYTDDCVNIRADNNFMYNVKNAFKLWSQTYSTHTTGYGIDGISINGNTAYINQDGWPGVDEVSSMIRVVGASADRPIRNLSAQNNNFYYKLDTNAGRHHSTASPAIGWIAPAGLYADANDLPEAENWNISNNLIVNSPISAFMFGVKVTGLIAKGNQIVRPGSAAYTGIAGIYRAAFTHHVQHADQSMTGIDFSNNDIVDDLATSLMYTGVIYIDAIGATHSDNKYVDNKISVTGATITSFNRPYYIYSGTWIPYIEHKLMATEGFTGPGNYPQAGSKFSEPLYRKTRTYLDSVGTLRTIVQGASAPTGGTYAQGDIVWNMLPSGATPTVGWICTVGGTPGTWVAIVAN